MWRDLIIDLPGQILKRTIKAKCAAHRAYLAMNDEFGGRRFQTEKQLEEIKIAVHR